MANNVDYKKSVTDIVTYYSTLMAEAEAKLQASQNANLDANARKKLELEAANLLALQDHEKLLQQNAEDQLNEQKKRNAEELENEIAELRAQGIEVSHERALQLAKIAAEEEAADKEQAELNLLKKTSKEAQKERDKKQKQLDIELAIAKAKDSGSKEDKKKADQLQADQNLSELKETLFGGFTAMKDSLSEKGPLAQLTEAGTEATKNALKNLGNAIKEGLNSINEAISDYAKYQTSINTRTYGSTTFSKLTSELATVAYSPLLSTADLYENLNTLVDEGIVTNVSQRAMLMTIKDAVVTTFDADNAALKRIIRLQQEDSTAARMGMEAYLNKFLNEFVENTEYLTTTFDNVADKLLEASALMSADQSAEFEYEVQKWLGSLTGVGLSESTAESLADAIGKLGSGDVSVFDSGMGSLLTMGASRAGLEIGDILNNGLDAETVNDLMYGVVSYISEIGETSSNIVKNQLASTFDLTITDLEAVSNFAQDELDSLYKNVMTYDNMYTELNNQFNEIYNREGLQNVLENLFSNYTYQTGMNIASNPAEYITWKITDLIGEVTGGINIPFISALGSGIDLETTVDNLMKIAIVGVDTIGNIGNLINGLGSIGNGSTLLTAMNIAAGGNEVTRGSGLGSYQSSGSTKKRTSGQSTSSVSYVGNTDSSSYTESIVNQQTDAAQADVDTATQEAAENDPVYGYLSDNDLSGSIEELKSTTGSIYSSMPKLDVITTAMTSSTSEIAELVSTQDTAILTAINGISAIATKIATSTAQTAASSTATISTISEAEQSVIINNQNTQSSNLNYQNSTTKSMSSSAQSIESNASYDNGTVVGETISTNSAEYLADMDFASGFKSIVENMKVIVDEGLKLKMDSYTSNESITGFYLGSSSGGNY